jgi:hypothetical protein
MMLMSFSSNTTGVLSQFRSKFKVQHKYCNPMLRKAHDPNIGKAMFQEELEDSTEVIRIRKSKEEKELLTLPEDLSSSPVFCEVCFTRSLVLCICFVDRCLFFCTFSFGYCVVCSSTKYGF